MANRNFLSVNQTFTNLAIAGSADQVLHGTWIDTKGFLEAEVHWEITANDGAEGVFRWRDSLDRETMSPDLAKREAVTLFNTSGLQSNPTITGAPQNLVSAVTDNRPRYVVLIISQTNAGIMSFNYRVHLKA